MRPRLADLSLSHLYQPLSTWRVKSSPPFSVATLALKLLVTTRIHLLTSRKPQGFLKFGSGTKKRICVSPLYFHFLCALSWLLLIHLLPLDWTSCKYKRQKKCSWLCLQAWVRMWKRVACVVSKAQILQTLFVIVPTLNVCHTIHSRFHHLLTRIKH